MHQFGGKLHVAMSSHLDDVRVGGKESFCSSGCVCGQPIVNKPGHGSYIVQVTCVSVTRDVTSDFVE